ncbi:phytanoyl-CoA dioxygenase domain-containing protein 1 homolog isoform X1 [Styela clava]
MGRESGRNPSKIRKVEDEAKDRYAYLKIKQDPRPDVYTKIPPQPKEKKPGQLNEGELEQYFERGFVVVNNLLDTSLLDKAREAVNRLVDDLANRLFDAGKIKNKHEDKGFFERLTYLDKEFPGAAIVLLKGGVLPKEFKDLWSCDVLLNVVEQLIGPEIAGHPLWNLRTKIPENEELTVPWHQDNAYLEPCSLEVLQATAWIPLLDANEKNGCMVMASGGHKPGTTATHKCCSGGTWYVEIPEVELTDKLCIDMKKDLIVCEVPYGGVLFLNNAIPHKSLQNHSDKIRYSLDLRWQRPDLPNGFYGMRENVLMRTDKDPNHKINWENMDAPAAYKWQPDEAEEDKLSPTVIGPWMHRWEIVHHNRHTKPVNDYRTKWENKKTKD